MGTVQGHGAGPSGGEAQPAAGRTRRRTERILLSVPISVEGRTPKGERFSEATRTVVINRHGARIQLKHSLASGATLKIHNLAARREGDFRVVGPTGPATDQGGEWGVECSDEKNNIWGIEFPPPSEDQSRATALLQCRSCLKQAVTAISLVEHDVLASSGLVTKDCKSCAKPTSWILVEQSQIPTPEMPRGSPDSPGTAAAQHPRAHQRVSLRLPIKIRDYYGGVELARSENISKGGICFMSERNYEVGAGILVTCPYDASGHNIEVRGRVVRCQALAGSSRRIYGVRYEHGPSAGL